MKVCEKSQKKRQNKKDVNKMFHQKNLMWDVYFSPFLNFSKRSSIRMN